MRITGSPRDQFFVLVSFEGPDSYASCGGLAQRVGLLAAQLAGAGFETHLFFLGGPELPAIERMPASRLTLHRWAQWLSRGLPEGVYDGEDAKRHELARSLPPYLLASLIGPGLKAGFLPTIIAEEWQTAEFVTGVAASLAEAGVDDQVRLIWRTGSETGWDRIDWPALGAVAEIGATNASLLEALRARSIPARLLPPEPVTFLELLRPPAVTSPQEQRLSGRSRSLRAAPTG